MKQYYITATMLFFCVSLNAQIINFPDVNFKAQLLYGAIAAVNNETTVLDANGNGEIEVEEATNISSLYLNPGQIVSLEGIQYFTNLEFLYCQYNKIENLDYNLPSLKVLCCSSNRLTHLDMSYFPELTWLEGAENFITSLDFSQNEMEFLWVPHNLLNEIRFGATTSDDAHIDVSYNNLSSLEIIAPGKLLHWIEFNNNPLIHLNIEAQSFNHLICSNTLLTHLDLTKIGRFQQIILGNFEISNNPNLRSINLKNNSSHFCIRPASYNCAETSFNLQNNPLLETICADEGSETAFLQPYAAALGFTLTSDCTLAINTTAISKSTIYPNPANTVVNIDSNTAINQIRILNMLGQSVIKVNAVQSNHSTVNIMDLKTGTYFVEVVSDKGKTVQKLIKQ